jgi:catechol 2,3-dioxygenase-like lactoylglutathione lyase family enzyme
MADLFHIGLTVKDIERSIAYYRDIAGMSPGKIFVGGSKEFDTLTNNTGAKLKVVYMTAGSFQLQLIEYTSSGGVALDLHHNNTGSPHISFYVPDVEAKYADLKRRGDVRITSGLVQIAPNMRSFYTEDPDGVPVEFLQMTR